MKFSSEKGWGWGEKLKPSKGRSTEWLLFQTCFQRILFYTFFSLLHFIKIKTRFFFQSCTYIAKVAVFSGIGHFYFPIAYLLFPLFCIIDSPTNPKPGGTTLMRNELINCSFRVNVTPPASSFLGESVTYTYYSRRNGMQPKNAKWPIKPDEKCTYLSNRLHYTG